MLGNEQFVMDGLQLVDVLEIIIVTTRKLPPRDACRGPIAHLAYYADKFPI